jgi:hypothetical protein
MSDKKSTKTMGRASRSPWWFFIIFPFVPALILVFLYWNTFAVHRMFHEWVGFDDRNRLWTPIMPLVDRKGNYLYADYDLNLFVIICTKDPRVSDHLIPHAKSSRETTLLPNTPHEITVNAEKDAVLIVSPSGTVIKYAVSPGVVRRTDLLLAKVSQKDDGDLLVACLRLCPPSDPQLIELFLSDNGLSDSLPDHVRE